MYACVSSSAAVVLLFLWSVTMATVANSQTADSDPSQVTTTRPVTGQVGVARHQETSRPSRSSSLEHNSSTVHHRLQHVYCVESEPVPVHHGITVASWRWREVQSYYVITMFIIIAALAKLGFHHAHFLSSMLPESCLLIILGIFMGIITYHIRHMESTEAQPPIRYENGSQVKRCDDDFAGFFPKFDSELFFLVLLPPIILEASYSLHDRTFVNNLGTVLLYAVGGTLFNMFIIGPALYGLAVSGAMGTNMVPNRSGYDISTISLVETLTFASLIVAVDPVAVLAIFQEVGVNKELYFLVFGESLLNDAVTVVLYNAMVAFTGQQGDPITYTQILMAVASFFTVSLGGLMIGIVFGMLTSLITKVTPDVRVVEPLSLLIMAYLSYLTAELVHFSGIIATVGCGVVQAHYAMRNISKNSYITIKYFITMASSTSDTIIFMFLGMVLVSGDHEWHTGFALWTLLLCLTVRFVGVYLLTWLANKRRLQRIGMKEQFIMAYGGLRGAVGFSLCVMLRDSSIDVTTVRIFITTTLFIILFTVFVQGSTIKLLVSLFHIKLDDSEHRKLVEEIASTTMLHITAGIEEILGYHGSNRIKEVLARWDVTYLQPLLVNDLTATSLGRLCDDLALEEHYANLYGPASALEKDVHPGQTPLSDADFYLPEEDMLVLRRRSELQRRTNQGSSPSATSITSSFRNTVLRRLSTNKEPSHDEDIETAGADVASIAGATATPGSTGGTATSPRRHSTVSHQTSSPHQEGHVLRRAFRDNPYNKLHFRLNRNLIHDEDQELDQHLRRRRQNAHRFSQMARQVAPHPSGRRSTVHHHPRAAPARCAAESAFGGSARIGFAGRRACSFQQRATEDSGSLQEGATYTSESLRNGATYNSESPGEGVLPSGLAPSLRDSGTAVCLWVSELYNHTRSTLTLLPVTLNQVHLFTLTASSGFQPSALTLTASCNLTQCTHTRSLLCSDQG